MVTKLVNISSPEIEQIIPAYGKVLEESSDWISATPESLLPYSREKIRSALMSALKNAKEKTMIQSLIIGLANLSKFIADDDAIFVRNMEQAITKNLNITDSDMKRYNEITNKVKKLSEEDVHYYSENSQ